jgi:hypothetical protein
MPIHTIHPLEWMERCIGIGIGIRIGNEIGI